MSFYENIRQKNKIKCFFDREFNEVGIVLYQIRARVYMK